MRSIELWLLIALLGSPCLAGSPATEVIVRPEAARGPIDNPLKGWCTYTDAGPIRQPYSMVFLYSPWSDLEPTEGRYAFERWESKAWSVPEAKGKHVVLRVYIDYPSKPSGLPTWLKNQGVKLTRYEDHGGGFSPDYDNPKMVAAMVKLIEALGKRYDQDPRVAFIQLGLLGFWGEWHTYPQGKLYASPATETAVIEAYHRAFPNKILLARTGRGFAGQQPWLGFHDDMFPEDTDNGQDWSFLAVLRKSGRADNWKQAVIGGEMVPAQAKLYLGDRFDLIKDMVKNAHFTWVGPYSPALERNPTAEFRTRSEQLVRLMGYQFRLTEIKHLDRVEAGGSLAIKVDGENEGVAPFSYPWPLEIGLIDDKGKLIQSIPLNVDIRKWLPGSFTVEETLKLDVPPGRYKIAVGIRDPWTKRPAVSFANKLPKFEGWTVISALVVEPKPGR